MIQLEATITHTEKKTLIVSAPSFWKEPTKYYDVYRAVLDEKTFIETMRLYNGEVVSVKHASIEKAKESILEAQLKWDVVTEQEFMQNYDDAWESMRLQPKVA